MTVRQTMMVRALAAGVLVGLAAGCAMEAAPKAVPATTRPIASTGGPGFAPPPAPSVAATPAPASQPTATADYPTPPPEVTESAASARSKAVGQAAPDFELKDQNYKTVTLADYRGHWLVVYFYPMADTPGCTCQATEFTKLLWMFNQSGTRIVGVSPGTVLDGKYFSDKYGILFPVLSDPEMTVIRKYGAWADIKEGPAAPGMFIRSTYLISPEGRIAWHWPEVVPQGHAQRVLERLAKLQGAATK